MKTILLFLCTLIIPFSKSAATLLTFDDLSPGSSYAAVPNGYGGLQWLGFGVLSGTQYPTYPYYTGMVSPTNVAFNWDPYDRRASISNSSPFNLESAYLTSGIQAPLQIEVQGFVGTNLVFDNTYPIQVNAPTLVNFDYVGVDRVKFLPEDLGTTYVSDANIFVMDNLSITIVPEPTVPALLAAGATLAGFSAVRKKVNS